MKDLTFSVRSDLAGFGCTEDGQPYTAEVFYVQAENAEGYRWNHYMSFPACIRHTDEDGWNHFENVKADAIARVEKLLNRILTKLADGAVAVDNGYWYEAQPAYGSDAYINEEYYIVERERMEG